MAQHRKRYGTLEHVRERKRLLEKMIAEMPENQIDGNLKTFACAICFKSFTYVESRAAPNYATYPSKILCMSCAQKESIKNKMR